MDYILIIINDFFSAISSEVAFILGAAGARLKLVYKAVKVPFAVIFLFLRAMVIYGHLKRLQRRGLLLFYAWRVIRAFLLVTLLILTIATLLFVMNGCSANKYANVDKVIPITANYKLENNTSVMNGSPLKVKKSKMSMIAKSFDLAIMRKNLASINPQYTNSASSNVNLNINKQTKRNILSLVKDNGLPAALAYHNDSLLQKFDLVDETKHDDTLLKYDKDIAATTVKSTCEMSVSKQCAAVNILLKGKLHLIRNLNLYLARHKIFSILKTNNDTKVSIVLAKWLKENKLFFKIYGKFNKDSDNYLILDNTKLFKLLSNRFKSESILNSHDPEAFNISKIEFLHSKSKLLRLMRSKKAIPIVDTMLSDKLIVTIKSTISQLLKLDKLRQSCNAFTKKCFRENLLFKVLPTSEFNIFKNTIKGTINE